jgi:hypothetical protein
VTRVITDDATQMLGIIDKHYRDLGKPPSGEKHGTYTPSEALGLPMGKRAEDRQLETRASQFGQRPWLHNTIMDKPRRECGCAEQRKSPTDDIPNEIIRCYHQSCTSAST